MLLLPGGRVAGLGNASIARRMGRLLTEGERCDIQRTAGFITGASFHQDGHWLNVQLVTNLAGRVIWHWYVNGNYAGSTNSGKRSFDCRGGPINVWARPTLYARRFSGRENAPPPLSGTRTIEWLQSADLAARYLAQYRVSGDPDWTTFADVTGGKPWRYQAVTPMLEDDTLYEFQVVPVDEFGNSGTPLDLGDERIVRWPDVQSLTPSYNGGTQKFTFNE